MCGKHLELVIKFCCKVKLPQGPAAAPHATRTSPRQPPRGRFCAAASPGQSALSHCQMYWACKWSACDRVCRGACVGTCAVSVILVACAFVLSCLRACAFGSRGLRALPLESTWLRICSITPLRKEQIYTTHGQIGTNLRGSSRFGLSKKHLGHCY